MFNIVTNVIRPERATTFPFTDIPVGGGLVVTPTDDETLEKIASKVRNGVAAFKKVHKNFVLTTHVVEEENHILVYREADKD